MLREFTHLTEKLKDPEYFHLLLEPIMIWGLAIGVLAFLFAFFFGERKMQMVALAVIVVSALAVANWTLDQRAQSDERVVKLRGDVKELIEESQERRRDSRGAYMLVAALAGLTMLMGAHKGLPGMLAGIGTAVVGTVVVIHGAWLHLKDAEIYHPNIRVVESAAPAPAARKDEQPATGEARPAESTGATRPVATAPRQPAEGRRALNARPR